MKPAYLRSLFPLAGAALLSIASTPLAAQERPDQERLRSEAHQLMEKARDLKAESERMIAKAEQLARQANQSDQRGQSERPMPSDRGPARDRTRPPEQNRDGDQAGPRSDGPRLEPSDRIQRFQERGRSEDQNRGNRRPEVADQDRRSDRSGPGPSRMERGERRDGPVAGPDFPLRRFHIRRAIRHLHAAGLHEQADRLEQRLLEASPRSDRRGPRRGPERPPAPGRGPDRPRDNQPQDR